MTFISPQKKGPPTGGPSLRMREPHSEKLQRYDVLSVGTFLALAHRELDLLALCEGLEAAALDLAEMCEHVRAAFLLDEADPAGDGA